MSIEYYQLWYIAPPFVTQKGNQGDVFNVLDPLGKTSTELMGVKPQLKRHILIFRVITHLRKVQVRRGQSVRRRRDPEDFS